MNKVEMLSSIYEQKKYGEFISFLGKEKCRLTLHVDKKKIKKLMDGLNQKRAGGSISDVLSYVFDNGLFSKPDKIKDFEWRINQSELEEKEQKDKSFYESLMAIPYKEVIRLNEYIDDKTPFSTKHGVKGAEFKNVLVVIDDNSWNQYNFNNVFCKNMENEKRYERTLNLLYVCCSRAKDKLAVLTLSQIDQMALSNISDWFGAENVLEISHLEKRVVS